MKKQRQSYSIRTKKKMKYYARTLLLLTVLLVFFQQLNVISIFSSIQANAQGLLLTVETGSIYEGDEATLVLTRTTEEKETIEFTLPDDIALDTDKSKANFSDTTEFIYDKDTNHVKVSYAEGESDKEVELYISCETAGTYIFSVTSTNEISENVELVVNKVVEDEQKTAEEQADEEKSTSEEEAVTEETSNEEETAANLEGTVGDTFSDGVGSVVDGVARVYNTKEYMDAIANKSVHTILVEQDFVMDESENMWIAGSGAYLHWNKGTGESYHNFGIAYTRDLVIDGQGHTVDFRDVGTYFEGYTSNPMNLTVKNFVAYGRNYWGPWRLQNHGTITVENVEYYGAQLTCNLVGDLILAGEIVVEQQYQYESPFDNQLHTTQADWFNGQYNLEATNLTIEAGAHYIGKGSTGGAWYLRNKGKVNIEEGAVVDLWTTGIIGEDWGHAAIMVNGSLNIDDGAKLNIHNEATGVNNYQIRPAINLNNSGASVTVSDNAELNIMIDGNMINERGTPGGITLSSGASFIVKDGGQLSMTLKNQGSSSVNAIDVGSNATFIIGKKGVFDVVIDGTGSKRLLNLGSGANFQFADAERVNLQLDNTNANSRLINMTSGSLNVDIQAVKAWTSNTWSAGGDDNETYSWTPIYDMKATYSGSNTTAVIANSLQESVAASFRDNFRTQNFRRVLFESIPDVEVTLNPLTNDTSKPNSYTITGITNPGAYVLLSGNEYIPAGAITGQVEDDTKLYHAIADEQGNFSVTLENGHYFTAGEVITAYAFMNGKDDTATTVVLDEVAPDKPILDSLTPGTTAFTGEAEAHSTVTIYDEDGNVVASGTADENGKYEIAVPSDIILITGDKYYATATDAAGNVSEASDFVIVADNGYLSLVVPENLSFGMANELPYKSERIHREDTNWAVQVIDTRYSKSEWQLTASLTSDFTADNGAKLEDLLVFATGAAESAESPLTSTPMIIAQGTLSSDETIKNISWNAEEGLLLRLLPGEAQARTYHAAVEWTLGDVPSNTGN